MTVFQFRSRGQAAFFAGVWLAIFVPFFGIGALGPTGFITAQQVSFATRNYAPLLMWTHQHIALAGIYSLVEVLPFLIIVALPKTLRIIIHGDRGGTVAQWLGMGGIVLFAGITVLNAALLVGTSWQIASASANIQAIVGADFRITSINLSIVADVVGGLLLALWLWLINFPLIRLAGMERIIGLGGLISAALYAATASLVAYDPQQTHQTLVGITLGIFGIWLGGVGFLLMRRSLLLGSDSPIDEEQFTSTTPTDQSHQLSSTYSSSSIGKDRASEFERMGGYGRRGSRTPLRLSCGGS